MYAIIEDGGRQLKVEVGKELQIDYRDDAEPGSEITFEKVLAVSSEDSVQIGCPNVEGMKVLAEVLEDVKGPKLNIAKFRRRKNSKTRTGHRQIHTLVRIREIVNG